MGEITEALRRACSRVAGAFCLLLLHRDTLYAVRDPHGFRPLVLGKLDQAEVDDGDHAATAGERVGDPGEHEGGLLGEQIFERGFHDVGLGREVIAERALRDVRGLADVVDEFGLQHLWYVHG